MEKVDLHLHSNISDGTDSPENLIKVIENTNIKIFAITDHDTIGACEKLAKITPTGIKFIPGIELTCSGNGIKCHILGYNCDYKNKILLKLIEKGKKLRKKKLNTRIEFLKNVWNIELTKEESDWLNSRTSIVKTHLGMILVKRNLAKNNVEAMDKYFAGCKTGNTRFNINEAINAIISSGGIPVWAHPLGGEGETHISEKEFLQKLEIMQKYGIQGMECYYSRYSLNEINILLRAAKSRKLLISGGSDYHGKNKSVEIAKLNTEDKLISKEEITILERI